MISSPIRRHRSERPGPTDDPVIEALRNRQVKNFLALDLIAIGTPMLCMGDELPRTQGGNNNAYCQDNETSWLDWTLLEKHADVHRFFKLLTARRLLRGTEHERQRMSLNRLIREANKAWHGARLHQPHWSDRSHSLAFAAEIREELATVIADFVEHSVVAAATVQRKRRR